MLKCKFVINHIYNKSILLGVLQTHASNVLVLFSIVILFYNENIVYIVKHLLLYDENGEYLLM